MRYFYPNFLPSFFSLFSFKPHQTSIKIWWFSWPPLVPSFSYMVFVPNKSFAGLIVLWFLLYPGKLMMWLKLIKIVFAFSDFQLSNHCFELFQNTNIRRRSHYLRNVSVLWHYYKEIVSFVSLLLFLCFLAGSLCPCLWVQHRKWKLRKWVISLLSAEMEEKIRQNKKID